MLFVLHVLNKLKPYSVLPKTGILVTGSRMEADILDGYIAHACQEPEVT